MKLKHAVVFATALSLAPISAFAAKKAAPAAPKAVVPTLDAVLGASGINVSGTVDASYDFTNTDPKAPGAAGHTFDLEQSSFVFHQLNMTISKQWSNGLSLVVNPLFGTDADALTTIGVNNQRGTVIGNSDFALVQAYLSYSFGDLTLQGGRFVTLAGSEVINSAGNINASRGFLFTTLQPLTHTGLRGTYALCKNLSLTGGVVNTGAGSGAGIAANAALNNNSAVSFEGQLAYTGSMFSAAYTTYVGQEDTSVPAGTGGKNFAVLHDVVVSVTPIEALTLGLNVDVSETELTAPAAALSGTDNNDWGVAGYVNFKLTPKVRIAARGEYLALGSAGAPAGGTTNSYDYINSGTLTFGYSPLSGLELIAEGRMDNTDNGTAAARVPFATTTNAAEHRYSNSGTLKAIYKF